MNNNASTPTPHPHSRLLMIITISVVLVGLIVATYYLFQARKTSQTSPASVQQATEVTTSTPTPSPEPVVISNDASAKTVATEVKKIDVKGIKQSIQELQTALSDFKQ